MYNISYCNKHVKIHLSAQIQYKLSHNLSYGFYGMFAINIFIHSHDAIGILDKHNFSRITKKNCLEKESLTDVCYLLIMKTIFVNTSTVQFRYYVEFDL